MTISKEDSAPGHGKNFRLVISFWVSEAMSPFKSATCDFDGSFKDGCSETVRSSDIFRKELWRDWKNSMTRFSFQLRGIFVIRRQTSLDLGSNGDGAGMIVFGSVASLYGGGTYSAPPLPTSFGASLAPLSLFKPCSQL